MQLPGRFLASLFAILLLLLPTNASAAIDVAYFQSKAVSCPAGMKATFLQVVVDFDVYCYGAGDNFLLSLSNGPLSSDPSQGLTIASEAFPKCGKVKRSYALAPYAGKLDLTRTIYARVITMGEDYPATVDAVVFPSACRRE